MVFSFGVLPKAHKRMYGCQGDAGGPLQSVALEVLRRTSSINVIREKDFVVSHEAREKADTFGDRETFANAATRAR